MSINYSVTLGIGYLVEASELEKLFGIIQPAETHEEPRFDPKTGKPVAPAIVIDREEEIIYRYRGLEFEEIFDLVTAIAKALSCWWDWMGAGISGETTYIFGPPLVTDDRGIDDGNFTVGGGASFLKVSSACFPFISELVLLGRALESYGLKVGEPWVGPVWTIS